jgi:hypothetical protein
MLVIIQYQKIYYIYFQNAKDQDVQNKFAS